MLRSLVLLCVLIVPTTAFADDDWSVTPELRPANTASIRVVEPEGYEVTVQNRTDQVPAVFSVRNADDYVLLAVRAPSGATWERKIEVKAYHQTVVRIRHVASAPKKDAARPAATASYVGVLANTTHVCKKASDRIDIRVELLRGADVIKTVDVPVRSRIDAEVPGGSYRARRYHRTSGGWQYAGTQELEVTKDGWIYHWGC